jgi:putative nucleotidyltransferase with HDIG domain
MLSEQEALELLRRYGMDERRIRHSRGVASIAYELATRIARRHPEFGIDPQRVRTAALLHDIGRTRPGDHEPNSVAILHEEGHDEFADLVMHGSYYEIMKMRGTDDPTLLPRGIENKIVAYADTRFRLSPVSIEERVREISRRRAGEHEKLASLRMALPRYLALEAELKELAK